MWNPCHTNPERPGGTLKVTLPLLKPPRALHQSDTQCPFRNVNERQICVSEPLISCREGELGWNQNGDPGSERGHRAALSSLSLWLGFGGVGGESPMGREGTLGAVFLLWIIASLPLADWQRHQPSYPRPQTSQTKSPLQRSKALMVTCNLHIYYCGPGTELVLQAAGETRPPDGSV